MQLVVDLPGGLDAGPGGPCRQPGEPRAPQVIVVLGFLRAAQGLAVDKVARIQLATAQQEMDAVVIVFAAGDHLVGVLELARRDAAVLGAWRRQGGRGLTHLRLPGQPLPRRVNWEHERRWSM